MPEICIIEDDRSAAKALSRLLSNCGYQTKIFHTAEAFIGSGARKETDCLLLDVNLPGINGLDLQEFIGSETPRLPIVFITGNGDVPMSVRAIRGGAVDFLLKPISEEALLEALARAVKIRSDHSVENDRQRSACTLVDSLTERENQVLRCVLTGAMNKQIGHHLGISEKTVKVHRGRVMQKLGARTIVDLLEIARLANVKAVSDLDPRGSSTSM